MSVFIYKTRGKFPDDFIIEGVDILLMARGSAAEVGYVTDAQLLTDLCDLNLEEYSRGLHHSHHSMGTSFSGTDTEQLKLAASTGPYYLSVVTNNKLEFTAKVAIESETIVQWEGYTYHKSLFGKQIKGKKKTGTKTQKSYEIIECEVVIEKPDYMTAVDDRITNKLQMYQHGGGIGKENHIQDKNTPYKPTYAYNSNKSSKRDNWWDSHYGGQRNLYDEGNDWDSYYNNDAPTKNKTVGFQTTTPKKIEVDKDTICKILREYCLDEKDALLPIEACIMSLIADKKDYGIDLDQYVEVLKKWKIFDELTDDNNLLAGLEIFLKEIKVNNIKISEK